MPAVPTAIVDVLNGLLEAEQNSLFRFLGEGTPYLNRASADVRRPLQEMVQSTYDRSAQLSALVDSLGGVPARRSIAPEEQYIAYLSLKFLLPRLVEAKKLTIRRYENALSALPDAPAEVKGMLQSHVTQLRGELASLERASEQVIAASK